MLLPQWHSVFNFGRDEQVEAPLQTLLNAVPTHQVTTVKNIWGAAYSARKS